MHGTETYASRKLLQQNRQSVGYELTLGKCNTPTCPRVQIQTSDMFDDADPTSACGGSMCRARLMCKDICTRIDLVPGTLIGLLVGLCRRKKYM